MPTKEKPADGNDRSERLSIAVPLLLGTGVPFPWGSLTVPSALTWCPFSNGILAFSHGTSSAAPDRVLGAVLPAIGVNAALCLTAALLAALFLRKPAALAA